MPWSAGFDLWVWKVSKLYSPGILLTVTDASFDHSVQRKGSASLDTIKSGISECSPILFCHAHWMSPLSSLVIVGKVTKQGVHRQQQQESMRALNVNQFNDFFPWVYLQMPPTQRRGHSQTKMLCLHHRGHSYTVPHNWISSNGRPIYSRLERKPTKVARLSNVFFYYYYYYYLILEKN